MYFPAQERPRTLPTITVCFTSLHMDVQTLWNKYLIRLVFHAQQPGEAAFPAVGVGGVRACGRQPVTGATRVAGARSSCTEHLPRAGRSSLVTQDQGRKEGLTRGQGSKARLADDIRHLVAYRNAPTLLSPSCLPVPVACHHPQVTHGDRKNWTF